MRCRFRRDRMGKFCAVAGGVFLFFFAAFLQPAEAYKIKNKIAVFAALDKVTARISRLEIPLNETVTFGALRITPRVCYTRPPTQPPWTSSFVEVDEVMLDGTTRRIFTGWQFAQSPSIHPVEHPVFDVWLTNCKMPVVVKSFGKRKKSPRRRKIRPRRRR